MKAVYYTVFAAGGIGRYTNELVRHMSRFDDLDAELICSPEFQWREGRDHRIWAGLQRLGHRLPPVRKARFLASQFVNPRRLARRVRELGAEIVHFSNVNHLTFPLWRNRIAASGARMVMTAHDVLRAKAIISRRWETRQLRAVYRYMDAIFVHSEAQRTALVDFAQVLPELVHVVPHGPYLDPATVPSRTNARRQLGISGDRQVALMFGMIRPDKNLVALLRAIASLERRPYLIVVGRAASEELERECREEIRCLALERDVRFVPQYVADEDISTWFAACDWCVLPYRTTFDSQSGVLNTSTSCRRPLLTSNAPTIASTVINYDVGIAADGDGAQDLATGVRRMMDAIDAGRAFEFDGYEQAHSWQRNATITMDVYRLLRAASPAEVVA